MYVIWEVFSVYIQCIPDVSDIYNGWYLREKVESIVKSLNLKVKIANFKVWRNRSMFL